MRGHGWLIVEMPPAEVAVHPAKRRGVELLLTWDDLVADVEALAARGVPCQPGEQAREGSITKITFPGGGIVDMYQLKHP